MSGFDTAEGVPHGRSAEFNRGAIEHAVGEGPEDRGGMVAGQFKGHAPNPDADFPIDLSPEDAAYYEGMHEAFDRVKAQGSKKAKKSIEGAETPSNEERPADLQSTTRQPRAKKAPAPRQPKPLTPAQQMKRSIGTANKARSLARRAGGGGRRKKGFGW